MPRRGARARFARSALGAFATFFVLRPYFVMKSSTIWRATSSGYWMGGDFLKYADGSIKAPEEALAHQIKNDVNRILSGRISSVQR